MNFACELMDLCRGTQEVEAVLSEGDDKETARDPLSRLKMAMEYEEKKVRIYAPRVSLSRLILTHSLTGPLDRRRVVAPSRLHDRWPCSKRCQQ